MRDNILHVCIGIFKAMTLGVSMLFPCITTNGQTYESMIEDHRGWILEASSHSGLDLLYFQGDTVINNLTYKKLHLSNHYNNVYKGAIREEKGRVYGILAGNQEQYLLYDFSASPGDTLLLATDKNNLTQNPYMLSYVIWKTDKVTIGEKTFNRQWLYRPGYSTEQNTPQAIEKRLKPCVQGIGWKENPFLFCYYYGNMGKFLGCRQDGEEIFMESDFMRTSTDTSTFSRLLEKGKEWLCRQEGVAGQEDCDFKYFLGTDTLIFGIPHVELYIQQLNGEHKPKFVCGLVEVDRKVYATAVNGSSMYQDWQLYDFALQPTTNVYTDAGGGRFRVSSVETMTSDGHVASIIAWNTTQGTPDTPTRGYWIEGVGSTALPVEPLGFYPGYTRRCLLSCTVGGKEIYNRERDFDFHEDFTRYETALPYHPMLKEGKKWNYKRTSYDDEGTKVSYFSLELHGDTVIGGKTCMKMYRVEEDGNMTFCGSWYEDGKKLYNAWKGCDSLQLVYDLNRLVRYDIQPCCQESYKRGDVSIYLNGTDVIKAGTSSLNRYRYGLYESDGYSYLVEGVGFVNGLLDYWYGISSNVSEIFLSCYENGECLCTAKEMSGEAVVPDVVGIKDTPSLKNQEENRSNIIYDLSGRRTDGKKPGVYIRGGKKFVRK